MIVFVHAGILRIAIMLAGRFPVLILATRRHATRALDILPSENNESHFLHVATSQVLSV